MSTPASHQSFSVTLFSARQYYAEVNSKTAQDCAQKKAPRSTADTGTVNIHLSVPLTGVLRPASDQAAPGPQNVDASTLWLDGVVHQTHALRELLVALRAGDLPEPPAVPSTLPTAYSVGYTNPGSLAAKRLTLAAALGAVPALSHLARNSPSARCAGCGAAVQRYHSPAQLAQGICARWDPYTPEATIELAAPPENLAPWCLQHGFTLHPTPGAFAHTTLDTLTTPTDNAERLIRLFTRVWQLPDPWQLVVRPAQTPTIQLSRTGICTRCSRVAPPPSLAQLTKLLEHGIPSDQRLTPQNINDYPEQLLEIGGRTIAELLNIPLSAITTEQSAVSSVLSKQLLHDLRLLRLDCCTLGTRIDTLSGTARTRLALLISLHQRSTITVTQLPGRALTYDPTLAAAVEQVLLHHAQNALRVILTEPEPTKIPLPPATRHDPSLAVGEITIAASHQLFRNPLTLLIQRGHTTTLAVPRELEHLPLSALIADALTEVQQTPSQPPPLPSARSAVRVFASLLLSQQYHLHHIPLFPLPPHTPYWCVAQELGIYELITELYASGVTARMHGINTHDLSFNPRAKVSYLCPSCRGAGVALCTDSILGRPVAAPCALCHGRRFRAPASDVDFRGEPLWHLLNSTVEQAIPTLSALRGSGPRLQLLRDLTLLDLPLGLPLSLLPDSARRRLKLARAILTSSRTTPSILVLEEPFADLTPHQATGMHKVLYSQSLLEDFAGSILSIIVVMADK